MRRLVLTTLVVAFAGLAGVAQAEDKPNPTGTWKWTVTVRDQKRETTLKLKLEGDKLTGAIVGRDNKDIPIEEAKYKDGEVSFKVTRERQGNKFTIKYNGKVSGDTIKGKIEREGQPSRDWEAKRAKDYQGQSEVGAQRQTPIAGLGGQTRQELGRGAEDRVRASRGFIPIGTSRRLASLHGRADPISVADTSAPAPSTR